MNAVMKQGWGATGGDFGSPPLGRGTASVSGSSPVVFLLGDEPNVVTALSCILQANGFATDPWTSPIEFLNAHDAQVPGCLVADVRLREMSGLDVQRSLLERGIERPVIFVTDRGDIHTTVLGMKAGAVTFLAKPVQPVAFITAVRQAITQDAAWRVRRSEQEIIFAQLAAQLTPREHQVLDLIMSGLMNKQIAAELDLAETTIKKHREQLLRKMQVRTVTALMSLLYWGGKPPATLVEARSPRISPSRMSLVQEGLP